MGNVPVQYASDGNTSSADIFQEAMGGLFLDLESVTVYIDDIIILGNFSLVDHLKDIAKVLKRLSNKGMQINSTKSSWSVSEVDYLGFTITREEIKPQRKKVQGILDLNLPPILDKYEAS